MSNPTEPVKTYINDKNYFKLRRSQTKEVNVYLRKGKWRKEFMMVNTGGKAF